jgi:peptide/nickel transport system permease protein
MVSDANAAEIERRRREEAEADSAEIDRTPVRTYWQLVRQRFLKHRLAVIAVVVLATLAIFAIVVPTVTGNAWQTTQLFRDDAPPELFNEDGEFTFAILGYNEQGQNLFARLGKATQTSLTIGLAAVLLIVFIGVVIGSIAGYLGGWVDNVLMRIMDVLLAFPALVLAIFLATAFATLSIPFLNDPLLNAMIAIGIVAIPVYARVMRASVLSVRERDFVTASRALGESGAGILLRRILPNALTPLIVQGTLGIATAILEVAALSFLGIGAKPPTPEWGAMIGEVRNQMFSAPHLVIFPGIALALSVLGFNLLGDGVRDALDPRLNR